ncbi:MAG: S8 family serine peptidase [bacterium]
MPYDYYALIHAYEAWNNKRFGNQKVWIAAIDGGINVEHQDFNLADTFVPQAYWEDVTKLDMNIDKIKMMRDIDGHNTGIAGIIGAQHNDIGIPGICPNCKILPIKVYDDLCCSVSDEINAISYAAKVAREHASEGIRVVISISQGNYKWSQAEFEAIKDAYKNNCIIVAGAGNDSSSKEFYPAAYPYYRDEFGKVRIAMDYDGIIPEVIAVASVGIKDGQTKLAFDSSYGYWVDVVAPGVNIMTLAHDSDTGTTIKSGTSFATPFVSGLFGLVLSEVPNFSVKDAPGLLQVPGSCTNIDYLGYRGMVGAGLINIDTTLRNLNNYVGGKFSLQYNPSLFGPGPVPR